MTQASPIDFWFSIGSLYTYLAVMRLAEVEARTGAVFRWRPFSVRAIMIEMDNIPAKQPVKLAYSWRDVERRAQEYGFAFRPRPPYPLKNFDLANRDRESWVPPRAGVPITRGRPIGAGSSITRRRAATAAMRNASTRSDRMRVGCSSVPHPRTPRGPTKTATAEARSLGIFGVPTFATRGEIFWGDDRLEDAIRWHQSAERGTLVCIARKCVAGLRQGAYPSEKRFSLEEFMRPRCLSLVIAASLTLLLVQLRPERCARKRRLPRSPVRSLRRGRRDGRRAGQRQEDRLQHHRHRRQRRPRPLQLPGGQTRAGPIYVPHPRGRIRLSTIPARSRWRRRSQRRSISSCARPKTGVADFQRRVDRQRARHRPQTEAHLLQLRRLPHARARDAGPRTTRTPSSTCCQRMRAT